MSKSTPNKPHTKVGQNVRSGYVAIIGLPNAGKSTLMNAMLGQKISITTAKPQTTRKQIIGILSEEMYQIIFLDTPGILKPDYLLQQKMMGFVFASIDDADVLLFIVDITETTSVFEKIPAEFLSKLNSLNKPKILVINKIDLAQEPKIQSEIRKYQDLKFFDIIIPASAKVNFNTEKIVNAILQFIPEHPKYYPDDIISSANERFFVEEIIREKILELYHDEVPYSCETKVIEFKERQNGKNFISVEIYVERDSQKAILIGKGGKALKLLGENSRKDIESFLDRSVYLDLHVKVKSAWRKDENALKRFGYEPDND